MTIHNSIPSLREGRGHFDWSGHRKKNPAQAELGRGHHREWMIGIDPGHSSAIYQRKVLNCCGTSFEPFRSASVKPKTKNWFGFETTTLLSSGTSMRKSLSLVTQRV